MKRRKQKHTYLFNCACVMFVYLASVQYVFAVKDENTLVFTSGWFKTERAASYDTIRHSAYLPAVVDTFGNFHTDRPGVRSTAATITLAINPAVVVSAPYDVILSGFCRSKSQFGAVDSVPFTLQINYRPAAGAQYKQRDAITITNCVHALVVASITVNGLAIATEQDTTFTVEVNISGDLVYPPNPMQSPSFYPIKEDITARNIKWSWTPLPWAEFYELEYLYIDNYKSDGTRRPRTSLRYNFRTDAVRIRVYGNEYELPVVFEQGYLVARVRGVGFRGSSYQIPVWGNWSLSDTGTLPERGHSVFEITPEKAHEADRLNWQYQSVFNENGERSEAVTYADGTLRIRQSVTNSPETNKILVTETFYDHHGRVAITTLPAPVKPNAPVFTPPVFVPPGTIGTGTAPGTLPGLSGTSVLGNKNVIGVINWRSDRFSNILPTGFSLPAGVSPYGINLEQLRGLELNNLLSILRYRSQRARLGYVPRFHVNVEGGNILRAHYDRDAPCDTTSLVLGTQSGAGRYYSPFNDEKARWQAYVPDGGGRPYLQVKYTNDGTGRVRETNLPGYAHRIGGGHSQKYYYGTPSQAELDRFFGNDAGHASFYKKTMIMDENGQAHVSIHDLKGNLVLSAYAGAKPENLDTVTNITVASDTIDLIAENNILLEEENAWVSNKRIALSAPTELSLSYRLVNPRYEGRLCMGTPVCYDCIYDLEITITDACGATRLEHRQTIGSLEPLSTCQTHTVNFGRTLRLDPGSYHIVKKLKVNAASIDQYVQHYTEQFTCSTNYTMFLPDIEAACTPRCITCIYDNITTRFVRRDGREVTLNHYKRCAGNNSSCQFACPRVGLSEIAMAWQTMLSEVSPGGQYAEYRDTSRLEDRPMGVINPAAFPLSVLNDDNQLPLRNATWRNPAFNYQTRTGETYYVPIADDGTPAHRSPESEIIVRDGRRHVLVKYLNDVSDFIRLWEPQWAEALVVYHPEYEYFLWNLRNRGSFSFDSLMLATERYADALRYGLTDYRNDPLFATPGALRAEIENRLNNAGALGGTTLTAAQLTIVSVHCGNPNFSEAQLRECYSTRTLFATPEAQDKEWVVYKALYRKMKQRVLANERNRAVTAGGGFNNRTIGGTRDVPANSLYAGKRRVFREEDDVHDELETDFAGEDPTLAEVEELRQRIMAERYRACGVCPVASDLTTLFNALNYDGKLTAPGVTLPGISPLVLTKNIVNSFSVSTALQYHWSRLSDSNPNVLRFKITTGGVEVCMLSLEKRKTEISWDSLFVFDCFQATGAYTFTMRIIDINGRIDTIQGQSSCFRVGECSFPPTCAATPARREMLTFLQYLFERNRYRSSMLTVHTHTSHSPHFGPTLRNVHPTGQTWQWSFGGFTSGDNRVFTARLSISEGRGALSASPINCDFTFTVLTPGFNFDSVGFVIALRKPSATPTADAVYEGEMIVRSRGGRIFSVRITNTCYVLFRCTSVSQRPSSRSAVCCLPSPRLVPLQGDCEESLRMIARREAERDFQLRRSFAADTLRAAYIRRCLSRIPEIFLVSYNDAIYMATLYYYDQSGALVKTVPPKGVRSLSSTQIANSINHRRNGTGSPVYPNHRMATVYRYTSLGTLAEKISPDEGATQYAYDYAGRQILSRDATQRTNNQASYIVYDANNRIVETGRTRHGDVWQTFRPYTAHLSSLSNKAEVSITQYDLPSTEFEREDFPDGQKNIRNRPAAIRYMEDGTNTTYVVGYSYDALGNIIRAVQYYPVLGISNRRMATKTTDYVYDKLSGQVKRITYQKGSPDQFIHWLSYDINKRLVKVQTSTSEHTPERHRETEARYYYYLHGPLARAEIGHEKIQGVDYAYTIQGWLKGINGYMTGGSFNDIGRDGTREGVMYAAGFAPDIFGEVLNYYPNDYTKISAEVPAFYPESPIGVLNTGFSKPIYNGFIQNSITSLNYSFGSDTRKTFAQAYSYDQAGRLRQSAMLFTNDAGFESAFSPNYRMHIQYDLNGNITRLSRTANSSALIDDLTYIYSQPEENNRLHQITDAGVSSATDLRSQAPNNYRYDNTGRLQSDASEGITEIQYNRQSKITSIRKTDGIIRYHYDAFGRRIAKTAGGETEWYVHDVLGRPLAVYTVAGGTVRWKESVIYGTKRIGLYKPDVVLSPRIITRDSLIRGKRSYELANHTGDVVAVVSDRKILSGTMLSAEIQAAHNYYPFGMTMPGRSIGNETYRYGFQGMQSEDEICGDNNSYTTEFRQYDPRVGRWWSVDPRENKFPSHSPYSAMLNNSILFKDENGAQPNVYRRGAARSRASDDILLSQMLEWGDDPIAGVEIEAEEELRTSKPNDLEMFAIELQRLEGNDDPLAGLPLDEPVNPIVTESRETRRRTSDRVRTVRSDAEILVNEIIMFEDEHVLAIRPAAGSPVAIPSTQAERTSEDYRIVRDAFEQGGVVMDIGGTVNDVVEIIQMARDEGLTIREGAEVLMRGSRNVGGMGLLGGFIGGANMLFEIYDDANALIDGDIGVGTYAGRSALNIIGGAVGCVPVVGAAASWGIEAFRDWALPRPER